MNRAFDVDILYQAEYHGIPIGEVAVKWQEIDGEPRVLFLITFISYILFAYIV